MDLKYLITGTGRCGTVFLARVLTSLGIACGHESIFDWKGLSSAKKRLNGEEPIELSYASKMKFENNQWIEIPQWIDKNNIEADASYMAVPFLREDILHDTKIIHVVRHPVKVINSFCNYINYFSSEKPTNSYENFIYKNLPELTNTMPVYDRGALFYIKWNKMIKSDFFYKIEDNTQKLLDFLGKTGNHFSDTTINTYKKSVDKFTLNQIKDKNILDELIELSKEYGYRLENMMI